MSNNGSLVIVSTNGSGTAAITCSDEASLEFSNITQLQVSGLEFIGCSIKVELADQFTVEDSGFHGGNNDSVLHLNYTDASIVRSYFVSNTAGTYKHHVGVWHT